MKEKRRILVLEDDHMLGEMIETLLGIRDFEVFVLNDSSQLVEVIHRHNIQLILMDKVLHSEDGLDICQQLKKNPSTVHIPVMMMSGHHDVKEICISAGANQFIAKPFDVKLFLAKIGEMWAERDASTDNVKVTSVKKNERIVCLGANSNLLSGTP